MKSIITILIALTLSVKSQSVFIYSITPMVCPGDSLIVGCIWDGVSGTTTFNLMTSPATIWYYPNAFFTSSPYTMVGVDKVYRIKLKVPNTVQIGTYIFKANENEKTVKIGCDVGIEEYGLNSLNTTEKISYFDLNGKWIFKPNVGELVVMRNGNKKPKWVIFLE